MKTYKEIILERMGTKPNDMTMRAIDCTDDLIEEMRMHHPEKIETFLVKLDGEMMGGHFNCDSAWWAICRMKPASMTLAELKKKLPDASELPDIIHKVYDQAIIEAREQGFSAPAVPTDYTEWDMLVTMAMFLSDYWMAGEDKIPLMVYQFLSDPDAPHDKIWKYIFCV